MVNRYIVGVAALLSSALISHQASAEFCLGVELRVTGKTAAVEADVLSKIGGVESQVVTEANLQTERLLSALKVATKQDSISGEQNATATQKGTEASASAWSSHRTNMQVLDATQRYKSVGYSACTTISKAEDFASAARNAGTKAKTLASSYVARPGGGTTQDWISRADGDAQSAAVLFEGGTQAANYINFVIGPPRERTTSTSNTLGEQVSRLGDMREAALQSIAARTMANVASYKEVDDKLKELNKTWIGDDGGQRWASEMAASHERGILLDAVRIEAATIASTLVRIKKRINTELAIAGYALARTDNLLTIKKGSEGTEP
ncbi:hypothetical protein [Microvirga puerhi]|uniref:DUF541 domain-containing protein n=1 Tax=Microvirga puerhi TaxID=2876078 RepID=A0ABS7VV47_9HYPH|nr:hypothetical protein [Microvirga puerhi]MBZ6078930.1 hypothetical protein [Microvirga puerhi]